MCGIAGVYRALGLDGSPDVASGARDVLAHRGPDDHGEWQDNHVSFFHWRLSIIDTTKAGHQPMTSNNGRFVICFNGEIYNFRDLRARLDETWNRTWSAHPFPWKGHSDTEVLLEAFTLWGSEIFEQLNGMFAFVIYDREAHVMWMARDRMGVKPLYFLLSGNKLHFASEEKFFSTVPGFTPKINPNGLCTYFTYGHTTGASHLIKGVLQVQPGEVIKVDLNSDQPPTLQIQRSRFCAPPSSQIRKWSTADAVKECRHLVEIAVTRQLVSDVPVGVFLSGGVDSSILTALTARNLGASHTEAFTLGYKGFGADFDEINEARETAAHLGVKHHVLQPQLSDLISVVERFVWQFDEPFANAGGLNMFLLSRMVREHVTVALAGEGGDEVFGGYRRYQVENCLRRLGIFGRLAARAFMMAEGAQIGRFHRRLQILARSFSFKTSGERYSAYFETSVPANQILRPEWLSSFDAKAPLKDLYPDRLPCEPVMAMCLADQQFWLVDTFLKKSDKGSMAFSLEVRVPFLDNEVVAFANTLPDRLRLRGLHGKWILKEAFKDILPKHILTRFKRGFDAPLSHWLKTDLKDYFDATVFSTNSLSGQYVQTNRLKRLYQEHLEGRVDHGLILWQVLVFEVWLQQIRNGFKKPHLKEVTSASRVPGV